MLQEIKQRYSKEIDEIKEALKWGFYEDLEDDSFEDDIITPFKEHFQNNFSYGWDNGATKGVLIFKDFGFVIKIPFLYCDGDCLCGVEDGDSEWNYCSQEETYYKKAKEAKVQDIFLETAYLDTINHHPIYIQLFAEPMNKIDINSHRSSTEKDIKKVNEIIENSNYNYIDDSWEADLFVLYGKKYYKKFKDFITKIGINDLRTANIGYIGKKPVILDYAGFNS